MISLFVFAYVSERNSVEHESKTFAKILADNIASPIIAKDALRISDILASVEYNEKITQTFALDTSWNVLGTFSKGNNFSQQRKMIPIIRENQNLWKDGYFYSVVPILKDDKQIGYLVVVASLSEFYKKMLEYGLFIIFIIFLASVITGKFRKLLSTSILQPIAQLDSITTKILQTKDLNLEIPVYNQDEIGELAKNFKHMIDELNSYHNELNAQKDTLAYQANYDSLTKLPNRALFNDRLHQTIYTSQRNNKKFALLFIDLDEFKNVNDTFGHEYGDRLLQKVAVRLKSILRQTDTLARLGGDEFVVIMNDLTDYHAASVLAQKMLDILKIPVEIEHEEIFISCSIGISLYPKDATEAQELIKHADIAMYRAKHNGRNAYEFYVESMTQEILARLDMQSKLRIALEDRDFVVHYQPQYNMKNDTLIGFEALVRWQDKEKGLIFPGDFIPYAEEFGMVVGINRQVMEMAMIQAAKWHQAGVYFRRISVNISIEQVEDDNFVIFVKKLLLKTECRAEWFIFELVESQVMKNTETAIIVLQDLSDLGIEIAVDDFGTGYSSLAYLKHLPINELKIDRSFIMDTPQNSDDASIVKAIIAVGKNLNLDLIAEGVETEEQKEFLLSSGCERVQGYLYGRPMSSDDIDKKIFNLV
ncbi:EAL domain-containing protein [Sulfurimonas paralvinellae]|uniref:EAL domain-containing protein n=1 Tax=Sulfurimonas paralvinellae TaxID=317658 RepID=A0A7M1B840_9BACT|nr:EAL domain-containing protein [Sulfurimonas paralvinellae]QOP44948.1 EAL domain-containing protein [Sulfurimonas paralvinellae]